VKNITAYSIRSIGIFSTGNSESDWSVLIVPNAFTNRYVTFEHPQSFKCTIPLRASSRKSSGRDPIELFSFENFVNNFDSTEHCCCVGNFAKFFQQVDSICDSFGWGLFVEAHIQHMSNSKGQGCSN